VLEGLRVIDLCDETGCLAGKILGDLGADVVRVEPPEGDALRRRGPFVGGEADPERSLPWLALHTSKRGIVLDLDAESGRERLRRLAASADVLIESAAPDRLEARGLGFGALRRRNPRLVWCAITPFGREGPHAGRRAHDLVAVAMGGNASMTGDPARAPLRCSLPTAYYHAAPEAVLGVLMALHARERTGRGQLVDVSLHECQLGTLLTGPGMAAHSGRFGRRSGARLGRTREIWEARDGYVSFGLRGGPARVRNLIAMVEYMAEEGGAPEWLRELDWSSYHPDELSAEELARIEGAFADFFRTRTRSELYTQALRRRILLAPCNDAREILDHPQLRARDFFQRIAYPEIGASIEHPAFFARSEAGGIGIRRRAPRLGEHTQEVAAELDRAQEGRGAPPASEAPPAVGRIFEGLRILELGAGAAGPVSTRYFAEYGARVVRIESRKRPDFLRLLHVTPERAGDPGALDAAPMFALLNPDKESLCLDVSKPEGRAILERLVAWADVVSENFSPGVMERWGFDWERLRSIKPDLVMVSGCLFGQTGPQRDYPGFGGQGSAIAGFNHLTGWPDAEAHGPYATITDSLSPRYNALLIAAALLERERTGRGRRLDVSQIEAGVYSLSEMIVRCSATGEVVGRRGNHDEHAAPHAVYPCRGKDRWIAIAVHDDAAWGALRRAMGDPEWGRAPELGTAAGRLAQQEALDRHLAAWTRDQDAFALAAALQAAGVEAGPVQDFQDLFRDPQLAARGHFVEREHPVLGALQLERSGFRLSEAAGGFARPGPLLGEHSERILREDLGMRPDEIERLVEAEVIA
jgi:crotonobetainyl-CoA:carnitine CoA-transferase CaiB-like acyl-CoA transferase